MHLSRSLAAVRPFGPEGYGRPYILDYKRGTMKPRFGTGEWGKTRDGRLWRMLGGVMFPLRPRVDELLWHLKHTRFRQPHGQFGIGMSGDFGAYPMMIGHTEFGGLTASNFALDSAAYTFGSAGDSIGSRIYLPAALTFDTVYWHIVSYTGTPSAVNALLCEIRSDNAGSSKPNTTVHANHTLDPASTVGWLAWNPVDGGPAMYAGSANTIYWLILTAPTGNTTDFATVMRNVTYASASTANQVLRVGFSSVAGWSTATAQPGPAVNVIKFSNGQVMGYPFTANANSASGTQKRGLYQDGLTADKAIFGIIHGSNIANLSGASRYNGATAPNGATDGTFPNLLSTSLARYGYAGPPLTYFKNTPYRTVFTYSGAATGPARLQIGAGANADLKKAMPGKGTWYWTEENTGVPDWSNDNDAEFPRTALIVADDIAGGASSPVGHQCGM